MHMTRGNPAFLFFPSAVAAPYYSSRRIEVDERFLFYVLCGTITKLQVVVRSVHDVLVNFHDRQREGRRGEMVSMVVDKWIVLFKESIRKRKCMKKKNIQGVPNVFHNP